MKARDVIQAVKDAVLKFHDQYPQVFSATLGVILGFVLAKVV